jgi:uncharacterized protein (DUF885 family)
MLDRRSFIRSTAAVGLAGLAEPLIAAVDPRLAHVLDAIAYDQLDQSPETLTQLGLDTGTRAAARGRVGDRSPAARARTFTDVAKYQRMLAGVTRGALAGHDRYLYDSVEYLLGLGAAGRPFAYGSVGAFGGGSPYVITQQDGSYQNNGEFLNSVQPLNDAQDAEYYLQRLSAWPRVLDAGTAQLKHDAALGVVAPDFLLDTALKQLPQLRAGAPAQARVVTTLVDKTRAKGIAGDWAARATRIVAGSINPALDRQIAAVTAIRAKATSDAGVWRLPQGDAYYGWALRYGTSTDLSPQTVHQMGLDQGADLDAQMDAALKAQGFAQGSVGERLAALTRDPAQLFPNDDAGKEKAVAYLSEKIEGLRALLPRVSRMQMKAPLLIKRVPPEIEAGAALGYMNFASLDGSRPAIYYVNLSLTSNWPKFTMPSLCAHEGLPGHTWQGAYVAEHRDDVPLIGSLLGFNAYTEGWALYSEQLVDELGFYDNDPMGRIGKFQALRFRASRLVADTGLHAKRWTRAQTTDFMVSSTGRSRAACQSEVDRYCAAPGQACGYKVGHTEITRLREKARAALGSRFDVRDYNDAVIQAGAVPLAVLATAVDDYIARAKG